jgi:hypothetical protein
LEEARALLSLRAEGVVMNIANSLRVSIYDKSGMLHVNRITRDFAPTSNGMGNSFSQSRASQENTDHEFEDQLEEALKSVQEKPIDYLA